MAYNWDWNNKCGELTYEGKINLYEGNGFLIGIDEWTEGEAEKYRVNWFFVDKEHAKRSLGLRKGYDDMFEGRVEKLTLYMDKSHNWKDIVELFAKSQPNIVIEILPTEKKEVV